MEVSETCFDEVSVLTVEERRIDAAVAIAFKDRMRQLTSGMTDRVILDLQHVEFIDSSGLGAIVAAMKQAAPEARLELARLTPMVAKVFHLTRMDTVFVIHDTMDTGVALQRE